MLLLVDNIISVNKEVGLMKKKALITSIALITIINMTAQAATVHRVVSGDTMWKISVKYETGLSEIINANNHIQNPNLIYPGDSITVPNEENAMTSFEKQVVDLVNQIRVKNGLKELKINWQLSRVARYKSMDMRDKGYFSHQSPTYGSPFDMMKSFGISYRTAGENIAKGQRTPQAVVDAWMNSSGHRANILSSSYTEIGVGHVSQGNIWTQMFIGK